MHQVKAGGPKHASCSQLILLLSSLKSWLKREKVKKTMRLVLIVMAVGFLLFYLRNWAPFMGVTGKSMEPELRTGDLILIRSVLPSAVKEGDVIVFEVPNQLRDYYNYPLIVAHRVKEIHYRDGEAVFRTKGDNTGEDLFVVRAKDLRGAVGKKISYLGFPLLFFQSKQALISIAIILLLIGLGTYGSEIGQIKKRAQKEIFSPVLEEQEKTGAALNCFSRAVEEYGQHLASHTAVMQDLAKTTKALRKVVEKLDKKLD